MTEKRFHPFAVLHLLRKTILVYLLPLVQVLFARNWAALWAALAPGCAAACPAQHGLLGGAACQRLADGRPRQPAGALAAGHPAGPHPAADMLAALTIDRPVVYRLAGASPPDPVPRRAEKAPDPYRCPGRCPGAGRPAAAAGTAGGAPPPRRREDGVCGAGGQRPFHPCAAGPCAAPEPPLCPGRPDPRLCTPESSGGLCGPLLPMARPGCWMATGGCSASVWPAVRPRWPTTRSGVPLPSWAARGGLLHRYEMRLCRAHLNYADLRRSPGDPGTALLPRVRLGGQLRAGTAAVRLEGGHAPAARAAARRRPARTRPRTSPGRSKIIFPARGASAGAVPAADGSVPHHAADPHPPLLVPDLFLPALLAAAFVGYRREGAWMQDDHLTLRRQKGFHLHCVCALHPDLCLTVQQSPWAVAAHRANLTLIFPGRLKQKVRSVALTELAFLQQAE